MTRQPAEVQEIPLLPITRQPYQPQPANGTLRMVGRYGNGFVDTFAGEDDPDGEVCGWCSTSYELGTHDERRCISEFAAFSLVELGEMSDGGSLPMASYTYRQLVEILHADLQETARLYEYPAFKLAETEAYLAETLDGEIPDSADSVVLECKPKKKGFRVKELHHDPPTNR